MVAFISRYAVATMPHFPTIVGTGFLVDRSGVAATNRHVTDLFKSLPPNPRTGASSLAAVLFLPGADGLSWQMLVVDVCAWKALSEFSSSEKWYGNTVPDIGFVQLGVHEVPTLTLASERGYLNVGMAVATIGYPMGSLPLTALGKLNQVSPFCRHGVISSVFPFPNPLPHGFTMDIMQQGGSSGSPVLRPEDGAVVGMMSSSVVDWGHARSPQAEFAYMMNTNLSIAEPAHIIKKALDELKSAGDWPASNSFPTLEALRAQHPQPTEATDLEWESFASPSGTTSASPG